MAGEQLVNMTADQILNLNKAQVARAVHPFTCPDRGDGNHRRFNGDLGALVATRRGWICPWCDYTQDWAHGFMATEAATVNPMERLRALAQHDTTKPEAGDAARGGDR